MSNQFLPRCAPIWGLPSHFTIADLAPSYQPEQKAICENISAPATSAAVDLGARGVELTVTTAVKGATFTLELFKVTGGGDVSVKKWTVVSASQPVYAGNLEMVDLEGLPVKVAISNISSGAVSVYARVTY